MSIDPVVLIAATMLGARYTKRKPPPPPPPPTPEQKAAAAANAERDDWNKQIAARRAEKKLKKGKP